MKIRTIVTLVGLAISFASPIFAQQKDTVDPEVRQQIEAVLRQFDEAYNKHDAAALAALFTPEAVEMFPFEAPAVISGQQAIQKSMKPRQANHLLPT
jgi:ketosteroid isomerase-like protein